MSHEDALRAGDECRRAALDGLRRGLCLIPCCPPDHVGVRPKHAGDCGSPGKAPLVRWKEFQDRRPTAEEIARWWRDWPNANVYTVLGPVSGLVGIDRDGEGGLKALAELSGGDLPSTWEFGTGRGGRLLYAIPEGFVPRVVHRHGEKIHDGLSLLGRGGGTVWPPSRHASGARYAWVSGRGPDDLAPAAMPGWLMVQMREDRPKRRSGRKQDAPQPPAGDGDRITEPGRNVKLASLAGTMRRPGMTEEEIVTALLVVNERRCDPPLDEAEVRKIAASVSRYNPQPDPFIFITRAAAPNTSAPGAEPPTPPAEPADVGASPEGETGSTPADEASSAPDAGHGEPDGPPQPAGSGKREQPPPKGKKVKRKKKGGKRSADDTPPRDFGAGLFRDQAELYRLARLKLDDPAAFEAERAELKKRGVSLRGLDHALAKWLDAARAERRAAAGPPEAADPAPHYVVSGGRLCRVVSTDEGPGELPLCNFRATVIAEVAEDDGAEVRFRLRVAGETADGRPLCAIDVPAEEFARMEWVLPAWGNRAVVAAGQGVRDHLRCALQSVSGEVPREVTYTHIGWREIDGKPAYLHAGGAIGPAGPVSGVRVRLPQQLAGYALPEPPDGEGLRDAVRASLGIVRHKPDGRRLAPDPVAFLTLVAPYRAALGPADYTTGLFRASGGGKTEMAALSQQHYGPGLDARHLPGSWSSTANALEVLGFVAKDALFTVDDFNPAGTDPIQLRRTADRLIRGQGNGAGRDRLTQDAALRSQKGTRCLLHMTGEDYPGGKSGMARLWAVDVPDGGIDFDRLTECQADAAAGRYAAAFAGWVRWLAGRPEKRAGFRTGVIRLRAELAGVGGHNRMPTTTADLVTALDLVLTYATEIGAVTAPEADDLRRRGRSAFRATADAQAAFQRDADPAERFVALVQAALASGRAHLVARDGGRPAAAVGWRQSDGGYWEPQGRQVGWVADDRVFLEPDAVFAEVVRFAAEQGHPLVISQVILWRRLFETKRLAEVDYRGGTIRHTVRRQAGGQQRRVLVLLAATLLPQGSGQSGQCGQAEEREPPADSNPAATTATARDATSHASPSSTAGGRTTSPTTGHNGHPSRGTSTPRGNEPHDRKTEVPL